MKNRPCYPVLCRFELCYSRIAPVLFPCLPYCSRFFPIFPCFSSTGQYDGGGGCFRPISPFLPISPRFSPLLPVSFPIPSQVSPCSPVSPIWGETAQYGVCVMGVLVGRGSITLRETGDNMNHQSKGTLN